MIGRIGVCCKWLERDASNHRTWAFRSLTRLNYRRGGDRVLHEVAVHNARVLHEVVCALGRGPLRNRMFRIGNHVLPCLTLPEARRAWRDRGFVRDLENAYAAIGRRARQDQVRLSTHPDQFIVPNSLSADVRARSVLELDQWGHWADVMSVPNFCVNIHLAPRLDGTLTAVERSWHVARRAMSRSAWRHLTVENDDRTWTAWDLCDVAEAVHFRPVVDVHHHWCVTGRWPRASAVGARVAPLWNGLRPKVHLSLPKGRYFTPRGVGAHGLPLLEHGVTRTVADGAPDRYNPRAHAALAWAPGAAAYARDLLRWSDIALEVKLKNLARDELWRAIDDLER